MTFRKTMTICAVSMACLISAPAFAVTQDDVAACRAATEFKSHINLDGYRLRFKSEKGQQKSRTLYFEAIPTSSRVKGERFKFYCTFDRKMVVALKTDMRVKYAKK